ncbi:MAG: diaminopimelate epimerase [Phycisphaeraceae bacterium]|nr:diaminopimelate epimerase [Phycisphaeraceae bacterium]
MRFTKMHGIGNDYVYIDAFDVDVPDPSGLAPRIADRHQGVGGDGLILVMPPGDGVDAHVRMRMFNADGSEAEMCGNGIRCVCKYAYDHERSRARPMRVQTGNGVLELDYRVGADGLVEEVTVDMGPAAFEADRVPVTLDRLGRIVDEPIDGVVQWPARVDADWMERCGLDPRMTCVSVGNPHVVLFCRDVAEVPLETVGPVLERHEIFPQRINVHFVAVHGPGEVTMRTWERGTGITQACGTGASAVCAAGAATGRTGRDVAAHLPGGDLHLHWRDSDDHVLMTGSATEVFTGDWPDH